MNNELSEQYLLSVSNNLQQEQIKLVSSLRENNQDSKKCAAINKEIAHIVAINTKIISLCNIRKKTQND